MKYMEAFKPCLIVSLKNSEEYSVRFPLFFIPIFYFMHHLISSYISC